MLVFIVLAPLKFIISKQRKSFKVEKIYSLARQRSFRLKETKPVKKKVQL